MFADEAFSWVTYPEDHVVYAKHRINEDGTPADPLTRVNFFILNLERILWKIFCNAGVHFS